MVHITTLKLSVLTIKRKGVQKIVDSLADGQSLLRSVVGGNISVL